MLVPIETVCEYALLAGVFDSLNVVKILGYGVTGLGFLLAYLAYRLLAAEQDKPKPRPSMLVGITLFMLFSLGVIGLGVYTSVSQPPGPGAQLKKCMEEAAKRKKDYLLESITMLIRLDEKVNPDGSKSLQEDARIVYTVRALKDISFDASTFTEQYTSRISLPNRWYGSDVEEQKTDGSYDVKFALKEGEVISIVTGAHYTGKPVPLPPRKSFGDRVSLGSYDETWTYPNGEPTAGDVICTLTIVIESPTLRLRPFDNASAIRLTPKQAGKGTADNTLTTRRVHSSAEGATAEQSSLSTRWNNVLPGEEVGIHFAWQP
jgi:hypothetical protein